MHNERGSVGQASRLSYASFASLGFHPQKVVKGVELS